MRLQEKLAMRMLGLAVVGSLLLLPSTAAAFGKNKIVYDTKDWRVHETTHFTIHSYIEEPEHLSRIASFAESAYEELSSKFNFQIDKKIPLIAYPTHAAFSQTNVDLNFIPEGVGAFAEPFRNRMVLPADSPDAELHELILHELTHIFEYEILFRGQLRRALLKRPPLWFMEGLASYMADDEDARDRMVIRDAVLHNLIPSVKDPVSGYFAYRFGHAVFDYMEETWGESAVKDFVFEFRSSLGSSPDKPLKRAFEIEVEDFDIQFRRWLRKRYVPMLVEHGEPIDFGKQTRLGQSMGTDLFSSVPSPSGDLAAAFAVVNNRVDVVVFGTEDRKLLKNLTHGRLYGTEYPIVQFVTIGPLTSRDLAWSPDGDRLAWFARRERGRVLVLVDALDGDLVRKYEIGPDQPLAPRFSPDGKSVVYRGIAHGRSDIYSLDLETGRETNLTDDAGYDTAPVISPDGEWLYYSVADQERFKIFRMKLADHGVRERVTSGPGSDEDASFSADGKRLFFSSSRGDDIYNIYSLELESGKIAQWTDAVGGSFAPATIARPDGERLLFSGFYRGDFGAYLGKMEEAVKVWEAEPEAAEPAAAAPYQPPVELTLDPAAGSEYSRWGFKLDDASIYTGITSDQRFYSEASLTWADTLGDQRLVARFQSLSSYTNYRLFYYDLSQRFQKGVTAFWLEDYWVYLEQTDTGIDIARERIMREAGVRALAEYPFDRYHRVEGSVGYIFRKLDLPIAAGSGSGQVIEFEARDDDYPEVRLGLVGDTTEYRSFGGYRGYRWQLSGGWGADTSDGFGTLFWEATLDARAYQPITRRILLAGRVFAGVSEGETFTVFTFGGIDMLRGYDYREHIGNRILYLNLELRFPLVDQVRLPFLQFNEIRGRIFLDLGGAWLEDEDFAFWNSDDRRLIDGLSAYGWGFSWDLGGLQLHWDFAQRWDLHDSIGGKETTFWIGRSF